MSFQNTPIDEYNDSIPFKKILPTYERQEEPLIQAVNFTVFFQRVDREIRFLTQQLATLDSDNPLSERIQKQLEHLEGKKKFYEEKVAYTVQHSKGPPKKICLMLHGMGDRSLEMAQHTPHVEDVLFIIPQAFRPFKIMWNLSWNYQWFDIGSMSRPSKELIRKGIEKNRPLLLEWIEDILEVHQMTYDDLILCGFSQGAITALNLIHQHPKIKYAIAVAGAMDVSQNIDHEGKYILLIHDPIDPMVPYEESCLARDYFKSMNANVTLQHPETTGHLIFYCQKTQQYMKDFIEVIRG